MENRSSIEGHVAVVTAGAAGIGAGIVERLAGEGARIALLDVDAQGGAAAVRRTSEKGAEARFIRTDATCAESVRAAFGETLGTWGRLDILVNCAGGFLENPPLESLDEAEWGRIMDWNLTSCYFASRAAAAPMKRAGYGRIVNISSISARDALPSISLAYSAAKSAMQGFTRRLAVELAPHGVTVNAVAPGATLTRRFRLVHGERVPEMVARLPVGFGGAPEDVADAVWYFSTPGSGYITGVTIDVNGGFFLG